MLSAYAVNTTVKQDYRATSAIVPMDNTAPRPTLDERFANLLICPLRVAAMLGKRSPGEVTFAESEQSYARRRLLHVEKIAIENKRLESLNEASFLDYISHELHALILQDIADQAQHPHILFSNTLNFSDEVPVMLDILSTKAASVSRLEPSVASMPWLYEELMQLVNSQRFRRKDARGRVIPVENLRTALSFIGIGNLRLLLPSLLLKRAMPQITDPFPQIKVTLSQYATATGLSARALACHYQADPFAAYLTGMLANLGRCCITRLYFKTFEYMHRHQLEQAQQLRQRDVHEALQKITPSANYLIALQDEFADKLTADLLADMPFKRLPAQAIISAVTPAPRAGSVSYSQLLNAARCYARVKMLHQAKAADKSEIKQLIRQQAFVPGALETLKRVDIFTLPFAIETDIQ